MLTQTEYFNTRYTYNSGRIKVWKAISEYLQRFISPKDAILEIGAGYCDFINQIQGEKKYAVDIDAHSKLYCNKDISFIKSSIFDINIQEKFNIIFASNFFEHFTINEVEVILSKLYNLLHDDGTLILIQPNYYYCYKNYWDDYTHKTVFSHHNLPDLLQANNFKTIFLKKRFIPFSFKSKLPTSYFLTKLYLYSPIKPFGKQLLLIAKKHVQK